MAFLASSLSMIYFNAGAFSMRFKLELWYLVIYKMKRVDRPCEIQGPYLYSFIHSFIKYLLIVPYYQLE